jgi:hypothetical protein
VASLEALAASAFCLRLAFFLRRTAYTLLAEADSFDRVAFFGHDNV